MFYINFSKVGLAVLFLALTFSVAAQTKRKITNKKAAKNPVPVNTQNAVIEDNPPPEVKKNSRPETGENQQTSSEKKNETVKTNVRPSAVAEPQSVYFYEFSKADFAVSKIYIEHDETGKGKITFQKKI
jgi:hypothetical protein